MDERRPRVPTRAAVPSLLAAGAAALVAASTGCADPAGDDDSAAEAAPEPLDLPDDPAATGVPVGLTTVDASGLTAEVWYPASDSAAGSATEWVDFDQFVPAEVLALVPDLDLPSLDTLAVRDAPLRRPESPYPVVVFSHGLGGTRLQSLDFCAHLASRGYVVVAADHDGRTMADLLPCLFDPALSGCDLSGVLGEDPAVDDVPLLLQWVDAAAAEGPFAGALDTARLALAGHSAGGGVIEAYGTSADSPFSAYVGLATAPVVSTRATTLLMAATCDAFVPDDALEEAYASVSSGSLVRVRGAGHLAFTDYCALELDRMAEELLVDREDVNEYLLEQLLALAIDGCPGIVPPDGFADCPDAYLPLETSAPIIRHYATAVLDAALLGSGPGVQPGVFPEADVE